MQTSLYAKFLGKALPLDQAKLALADAWRGIGSFTVADLPNGFYFIKCESSEMQDRLLWDGPWTVAGRILQLSPWFGEFPTSLWKALHRCGQDPDLPSSWGGRGDPWTCWLPVKAGPLLWIKTLISSSMLYLMTCPLLLIWIEMFWPSPSLRKRCS